MTTRQLIKAMFSDGDLVILIAYAVAGLAWGMVDRIRGSK